MRFRDWNMAKQVQARGTSIISGQDDAERPIWAKEFKNRDVALSYMCMRRFDRHRSDWGDYTQDQVKIDLEDTVTLYLSVGQGPKCFQKPDVYKTKITLYERDCPQSDWKEIVFSEIVRVRAYNSECGVVWDQLFTNTRKAASFISHLPMDEELFENVHEIEAGRFSKETEGYYRSAGTFYVRDGRVDTRGLNW